MIEQIAAFFTIEMIYLWLNIGVIPFWLILIIFPQSKICGLLSNLYCSFFYYCLLYIAYLGYYFFISGYDFDYNFTLYLGIYDLRNLFESEAFLIMFWTHFLAVNLFCGAWIMKDSQKLFISKYLVFIPLIITYFIGPIGLVIYWIIRMFYAKRINLLD